jgi:hypothetical protein
MTFDFVSGLLGGLHRPWWGNLEITHRDSMGRLAKVGRPSRARVLLRHLERALTKYRHEPVRGRSIVRRDCRANPSKTVSATGNARFNPAVAEPIAET